MTQLAPFTELRIKIERRDDDAFEARVALPSQGVDAGPFPFVPPIEQGAREDLRWYLERYYRWPAGEESRAAAVERQLEDWGRDLFQAVFADPDAMRLWVQFRAGDGDADGGRLITLDCTESEVLRQPWELLADEEGHLFALGIGFRRRLHKAQGRSRRDWALPVRVLMVVPRPEGDQGGNVAFIDPRASSQALLDAVEPLGPERVSVEFLHPPTLKALTNRLRRAERGQAPPVHVVHFDGHGLYAQQTGLGYLLFEDQQGRLDRVDARRLGTLLARAAVPLMVLDACQSAHADAPDPYSGVAQRLIRAGVGSVVAMQYSVLVPTSKQFFAAFYQALAQGGTVGQAMDEGRYDLLAETFRFMLHRPDGSDKPFHLQDWFLPALYQWRDDPAPFAGAEAADGAAAPREPAPPTPYDRYRTGLTRMLGQLELTPDRPQYDQGLTFQHRLLENIRFAELDGDTETRRAERSQILRSLDALCERALGLPFGMLCPEAEPSLAPSPGAGDATAPLRGDFPTPPYGFVGRARELWRVERLLHDRPVVVIHGFGGQGKTALATETARWLTRTGRFARAVFLSFEQGGDADWAMTQMGRLLLGDDFSSLGEADRRPALEQALTGGGGGEGATLLVWDNFESVTPGGNAALAPADLQALLTLGAELARTGEGAGSRLLVTTRETALAHEGFRAGRRAAWLPLGGLTRWEGLHLAGEVLDGLGLDRPADRRDLERLLTFLGGHPLSIQLVVPHLHEYADVATVIDRFEELYPGFVAGEAQARNESLDVSLRFSLDRLSDEVRDRLPALGVFQGGALEVQILMVTGLQPSEWRPVREGLARAGLVTPELESPFSIETEEGQFGGHYLRFHPTLAPHLRRELDEPDRAALEAAYRRAYYALSRHLYYNDDRDPLPTRAVARRELPNLRQALDLALTAGEDGAVEFADNVELFLNLFGRWREREALVERVASRVGPPAPGGAAGVTKDEVRGESRRGEWLLDQGRAGEAEGVFRRLLAQMNQGMAYGGIDAGYDRAQTLGRLGRCLRFQGRHREAEAEYRRALAALAALDPGRASVQRETGAVHTDLGDVLTKQGRYAEARAAYERGLEYIQAVGDDPSEGVILGQLGTLALVQGELDEARRRYEEALRRFRELGETRSEAIYLHQLGMVAEEARDWAAADEAYRESLRLEEALGDRAGAAQTANQLALVAQGAGRPADAERWYRRAIDLNSGINKLDELARNYNNLADLLLSVARAPQGERPAPFAGRDLLAEAEELQAQAIGIFEEIGQPDIFRAYSVMADIAEARGADAAAVQAWRRQERAAYAAFPGNWAKLQRQWGAVVAAVGRAAGSSSIPPPAGRSRLPLTLWKRETGASPRRSAASGTASGIGTRCRRALIATALLSCSRRWRWWRIRPRPRRRPPPMRVGPRRRCRLSRPGCKPRPAKRPCARSRPRGWQRRPPSRPSSAASSPPKRKRPRVRRTFATKADVLGVYRLPKSREQVRRT